uniref:Nucleoprotein n=1 Tax=Duck rhabdovirus TaxID=2212761 RepID=A0A3G1RP94_9RHAB|nr:MAG: nucleocapsid protein [Duck rhabdovirus]
MKMSEQHGSEAAQLDTREIQVDGGNGGEQGNGLAGRDIVRLHGDSPARRDSIDDETIKALERSPDVPAGEAAKEILDAHKAKRNKGVEITDATEGTSVFVVLPVLEDEPQYPADYFVEENTKPTVTIKKPTKNLDVIRASVVHSLRQREPNIEVCMTYLVLMMLQIKAELNDYWVSYKTIIGKKDETVTPRHLINIRFDGNLELLANCAPVDAVNDQWILTYLLCLYRLGRATQKGYRDRLLPNINNILRTLPGQPQEIPASLTAIITWVSNSNFCKIAAAYDMFFNRFRNHDMVVARIGTLPARYRDCGGWTALCYYHELMGKSPENILLEWIYVKEVATELKTMFKKGQEMDDPYGYAPYMMEFGISKSSPYSAKRCKNFHNFVHFFGCLSGAGRSINSVFLEGGSVHQTLANAQILAYCRAKYLQFTRQFIAPDEHREEETAAPVELNLTSIPASASPKTWFRYLEMQNFMIPDTVTNWAREMARIVSSRASRETSVAAQLTTLLRVSPQQPPM